MTAQDFQDRLDALVVDLQTKGKGQTVNVIFRQSNNTPIILPLSSDATGVVNAGQLFQIQAFVTDLRGVADTYTAEYAPVQAASEAFRVAERTARRAL